MAVVTTRYVHPTIGNHSWGLPLRVIQFIFATLVMSLSAYTLSKITGWREVRFTVAAVRSLEPFLQYTHFTSPLSLFLHIPVSGCPPSPLQVILQALLRNQHPNFIPQFPLKTYPRIELTSGRLGNDLPLLDPHLRHGPPPQIPPLPNPGPGIHKLGPLPRHLDRHLRQHRPRQ
jgi:hypothetical protein